MSDFVFSTTLVEILMVWYETFSSKQREMHPFPKITKVEGDDSYFEWKSFINWFSMVCDKIPVDTFCGAFIELIDDPEQRLEILKVYLSVSDKVIKDTSDDPDGGYTHYYDNYHIINNEKKYMWKICTTLKSVTEACLVVDASSRRMIRSWIERRDRFYYMPSNDQFVIRALIMKGFKLNLATVIAFAYRLDPAEKHGFLKRQAARAFSTKQLFSLCTMLTQRGTGAGATEALEFLRVIIDKLRYNYITCTFTAKRKNHGYLADFVNVMYGKIIELAILEGCSKHRRATILLLRPWQIKTEWLKKDYVTPKVLSKTDDLAPLNLDASKFFNIVSIQQLWSNRVADLREYKAMVTLLWILKRAPRDIRKMICNKGLNEIEKYF